MNIEITDDIIKGLSFVYNTETETITERVVLEFLMIEIEKILHEQRAELKVKIKKLEEKLKTLEEEYENHFQEN